MLSPSARDTVSKVDERLSNLYRDEEDQILQLPQSITEFSPGVEVALLQLITTWAAFSKEKRLLTSISSGLEITQSLSTLSEQAYGTTALLCAKTIALSSGQTIEYPIRNTLPWRHQPLITRENASAAALILADPKTAPRSYAAFLNLSTEGLRAEKRAHFTKHIATAINAFQVQTRAALIHGRNTDLPEILYELLSNAEEWGCTNVDKVPIKLPIRGILLRIHRTQSIRIADDDRPISVYLKRERANSICRNFLEVSVFDSGIGLGQRYLRRKIEADTPIDIEMKAIRDCFAKHGSIGAHTSRGLGLYHVMLLANQLKGFLRLRTGRVHLYRDFGLDPYLIPSDTRGEITPHSALSGFQYLRDWSTHANDHFSTYAYAKGAVYNLILPMKESQMNLL